MSETVFILGAGASKAAGAPLIGDFLDRASELHKKGEVGDHASDFARVFSGISKLQAVHSKAELDLNNIEAVFAAFDMGKLVGRLPGLEGDEINQTLVSLKRLIVVTLEFTTQCQVREGQIRPDETYANFVELLERLQTSGHSCSVITFNYDIALDYALHFLNARHDYCLSEGEERDGMPLLKLHGSINWARCGQCERIVPWRLGTLGTSDLFGVKLMRLNLGTDLRNAGLSCCGKEVVPEPVLVPPTWNKSGYQGSLVNVWRQAAKELSEAENIVVSGYSLTETDCFFRFLFAVGAVGTTMVKRFWVFDPDSTGAVNRRFHALLGPASRARYRYHPFDFGFAIGLVKEQFSV